MIQLSIFGYISEKTKTLIKKHMHSKVPVQGKKKKFSSV